MTSKARIYRELLRSGEFIVAPGIYDGYSARLVAQAGFRTAATSGAAISNALLGVPDIGVLGLAENVDHCRNLARCVDIPLTADADNGYGNPVNVHHAVRGSRRPAWPASTSRTRWPEALRAHDAARRSCPSRRW